MSWYACFKALRKNKCLKREEVKQKNLYDFDYANSTNVPEDRERAWDIAERRMKILHGESVERHRGFDEFFRK